MASAGERTVPRGGTKGPIQNSMRKQIRVSAYSYSVFVILKKGGGDSGVVGHWFGHTAYKLLSPHLIDLGNCIRAVKLKHSRRDILVMTSDSPDGERNTNTYQRIRHQHLLHDRI